MSGPAAGILYINQNASAFSEMFCVSKTLHVFIDENTSYAAGVLHIAKQYFISVFVGRQPDKFRFDFPQGGCYTEIRKREERAI